MKWFLVALPMAASPAVTVYSGTFLDDFNDGNLDGWDVQFSLEFPDSVKIKSGYLVMDTTAGKQGPPALGGTVAVELKTGDEQNWDSYTLTCRVRFSSELIRELPLFDITVQRRKGRFDLMAGQVLSVFPIHQRLQVDTIPPDAKPDHNNIIDTIRRVDFGPERLRRRIKLDQWLPIKMVVDRDYLEFHFDDRLVTQYEDKSARPGTVRFRAAHGMLVHVDDVVISGPRIPNIGGPHNVDLKTHLATTWGEIKNAPRR